MSEDIAKRAAQMPECPGPDCSACNGEQCWLCRAGCDVDLDRRACQHDVTQRHTHATAPSANATEAAPTALWNEYGTPLQPHVACPSCLEDDEVGSHFDSAWCYFCGWRGSLTEQHGRATLVNEVTAAVRDEIVAALPALGMTFVEVLVDRPVDDRMLPAATFVVRQFSCGYVETDEQATSPADFDPEVQ